MSTPSISGTPEPRSSITRIQKVRGEKHGNVTVTTFRVPALVSAKIQPEAPILNLSNYFSVDGKGDFDTYFALFLREMIGSEYRNDVGHVLDTLQDRFGDSLIAMNKFVAGLDAREDSLPLTIQNNELIELGIPFDDRVRYYKEKQDHGSLSGEKLPRRCIFPHHIPTRPTYLEGISSCISIDI